MPATTQPGGAPGLPARETVLEACDASFGYGKLPVVDELSLRVEAGQVVALLGANGAGKTTTLLGLAGVLRASRGQVLWRGQPARSPLHVRSKQGLGYLPEERGVIFGLSVADNLRLGRGGIASALEIAPELEPLLKRRAGLLSGGEQQILALARVLAARPRVVLADELSLGLAPLISERLLVRVREAAIERQMGVVLVEQHIRQALKHADYAYVMRRGRIVMAGPAEDLRSRIKEIEATYLSLATADR